MLLLDTLNELKDNVENISTETIKFDNIIQNDNSLNIERIPQETLNKINRMFNLVILKNNIDKLQKVDFTLAQEVFTMLPDLPKSEEAKLTSNPSMINKEILNKIFNTFLDNKISVDISDKVNNLKILIENNLDKFNEIYRYIQSFKDLIEFKLEVLNSLPPIVVERKYHFSEITEEKKNKNINLLTDAIYDINYLDDTKLEYDKYNGVLVNKFKELYNDATLKELSTIEPYLDLSKVSLQSFIIGINSINRSLQYKETNLKDYVFKLNIIRSGNDILDNKNMILNNETIDFINRYDSIVSNLEYLNKIYEIIKIKNNCFDKLVDLINFLT